jgi:hypothetical protein
MKVFSYKQLEVLLEELAQQGRKVLFQSHHHGG